jgi:hypothetical protein
MLKPNETLIRTSKCGGKVPKERGQKVTGGLTSVRFTQKIEWEDVDGELALTNQRLIVIGERGRMRKEIIPVLELNLGKITAISTSKGITGEEKLLLSLDLGTEKPEKTDFDVKEASSWVTSIRGQLGQPIQQVQQSQPAPRQAAKYCASCGGSLEVGNKFCTSCGSSLT